MKIFFKIFAGLIVVLILAVVGFVYSFDANNYKEELTEIAESIVGRPITIAGDINISLYPWIGIKIDKVTIDNPVGFSKKTFATIGQFDVRIKITPLIQKRLDIEKLVMHRLAVDFEKNAAGVSNWSDITGSSESEGVEAEFGLAGLDIGGIELANSKLSWLDIKTGKRFKISTMKLSTKAVIEGQPLPVSMTAYIESNQPEWQASVNAKTKLEFNGDSVVFNANDLKLVVKALLPSSSVGNVSFVMQTDSEINLETKAAKLTKTRFSVLGLVMSGTFDVENIFSVPVIQGPVKVRTFEAQTLAKHFKITIPEMDNAQSLKKISLTTAFKTDFNAVYMDDIVAKVDESSVSGYLHITGMDKPVVRYDLKVDKIKWADYRSAESDASKDEMPLPLDLIRVTDLEGKVNIDIVTADEIKLTKVHATSRIKNGIVKVNPITLLVNESDVKAAMQLDARKKPKGMLVAKVKNVDANASINPLLKTIMGENALIIEGIVNADASIKTSGSNIAALKKLAKGKIKINMDKTIIQGIDLSHASRLAAADYANKNKFITRPSFVTKYEPGRKTEFKSLHATLDVSRGKLINNDLLLVSDAATITGSGSIDFTNEKLDYRPVIDMHIKNTVDMRDKFRDHPMEYHAHGVFKNLSNEFDVEKYELLLGRVLVQEGKRRRNIQRKNKSGNEWNNVLSK
jgi:AsmA protein